MQYFWLKIALENFLHYNKITLIESEVVNMTDGRKWLSYITYEKDITIQPSEEIIEFFYGAEVIGTLHLDEEGFPSGYYSYYEANQYPAMTEGDFLARLREFEKEIIDMFDDSYCYRVVSRHLDGGFYVEYRKMIDGHPLIIETIDAYFREDGILYQLDFPTRDVSFDMTLAEINEMKLKEEYVDCLPLKIKLQYINHQLYENGDDRFHYVYEIENNAPFIGNDGVEQMDEEEEISMFESSLTTDDTVFIEIARKKLKEIMPDICVSEVGKDETDEDMTIYFERLLENVSLDLHVQVTIDKKERVMTGLYVNEDCYALGTLPEGEFLSKEEAKKHLLNNIRVIPNWTYDEEEDSRLTRFWDIEAPYAMDAVSGEPFILRSDRVIKEGVRK